MNLICFALVGLSIADAFTQLSKATLNRRQGVIFSTGIYQECDGQSVLEKARKIAWSNDEVLILDAELYLNQVLELERCCSSGDRTDDVCEVVDSPMMAEVRELVSITMKLKNWIQVVSQLRVKSDLAEAIR